jgi:hypothetical protein
MKRFYDRYRDTLLGVAPVLIVLAGIFALQRVYGYVITSFDDPVAGLDAGTMYVVKYDVPPCVGDAARFRRPGAGSILFLRRVVAGPGATFTLTDTGYAIDGKPVAMDALWRAKAAVEAGAASSLTIPSNHVLVINTSFKALSKTDNWAFAIVPRDGFVSTVTRVLFSRDLTRIGERVNVTSGGCGGSETS